MAYFEKTLRLVWEPWCWSDLDWFEQWRNKSIGDMYWLLLCIYWWAWVPRRPSNQYSIPAKRGSPQPKARVHLAPGLDHTRPWVEFSQESLCWQHQHHSLHKRSPQDHAHQNYEWTSTSWCSLLLVYFWYQATFASPATPVISPSGNGDTTLFSGNAALEGTTTKAVAGFLRYTYWVKLDLIT